MIKIEIPEFDFSVNLNNYKDIPKETSGIYIIFDKEDTPLYVGQASCLRSRLYSHFKGHGSNNTQRFAWAFDYAKAFIEEDQASKNVYEQYFINFWETPLNKRYSAYFKVPEYKGDNPLKEKAYPWKLHPAYCQYVLDNGKQCQLRPHLNGTCHVHGGNGISRQSYIDKAIEEFERMAEAEFRYKRRVK